MFFLKEIYSGVYPKGSYYTFNVKLKAKRFLKLSLSLQKQKKRVVWKPFLQNQRENNKFEV